MAYSGYRLRFRRGGTDDDIYLYTTSAELGTAPVTSAQVPARFAVNVNGSTYYGGLYSLTTLPDASARTNLRMRRRGVTYGALKCLYEVICAVCYSCYGCDGCDTQCGCGGDL